MFPYSFLWSVLIQGGSHVAFTDLTHKVAQVRLIFFFSLISFVLFVPQFCLGFPVLLAWFSLYSVLFLFRFLLRSHVYSLLFCWRLHHFPYLCLSIFTPQPFIFFILSSLFISYVLFTRPIPLLSPLPRLSHTLLSFPTPSITHSLTSPFHSVHSSSIRGEGGPPNHFKKMGNNNNNMFPKKLLCTRGHSRHYTCKYISRARVTATSTLPTSKIPV